MKVVIAEKLLKALVALETAVQSAAGAKAKPDLRPLWAQIDELADQLPRDADPTLIHYLHKKSYTKARLYLQGRDAENRAGGCRHV